MSWIPWEGKDFSGCLLEFFTVLLLYRVGNGFSCMCRRYFFSQFVKVRQIVCYALILYFKDDLSFLFFRLLMYMDFDFLLFIFFNGIPNISESL